MARYLKANNFELSVSERQYLFQCRVSNIETKANRSWKYDEIHCISCKDKNIIETGKHILECTVLNDKNYKISYIQVYEYLYISNIQDQVYTSNMMKENMKIRETLKEAGYK